MSSNGLLTLRSASLSRLRYLGRLITRGPDALITAVMADKGPDAWITLIRNDLSWLRDALGRDSPCGMSDDIGQWVQFVHHAPKQ